MRVSRLILGLLVSLPAAVFAAQASHDSVDQLGEQLSRVSERYAAAQTSIAPKQSDKVISIQDAVLLAVRYNPAVVSARLQRVSDHYALELARYHYAPQFALQANIGGVQGALPTRTVTGAVSQNLSTGGTLALTSTGAPDATNHFMGTTAFSLTQPLLSGAGRTVGMATLDNALDQERMNRLSYKANLMQTVVSVLSAYRQLARDYIDFQVQELALAQSKRLLKEYQLKVRAGQLPRMDIVTQIKHVLVQELSLKDAQTKIQTDRNALKIQIGLRPDAQVDIQRKIALKVEALPSRAKAIQIVLKHNPAYQQQLLRTRQLRRGYRLAQDADRISADLVTMADSHGAHSALLQLSVPLDNKPLKVAVVNARVALQKAYETNRQMKDQLMSQIKTALIDLQDRVQQIGLANLEISAQKHAFGMKVMAQKAGYASTFELQSQQNQLVDSRTDLINRKIGYLGALSSFHQLLGDTLKRWDVELSFE